MSAIPVMRPKLPSAEHLHPYLQRIDGTRIYSNFGPLAQSLEERLEGHFGLQKGAITTVANATFGLTTALSAQGPRRGTLCVMPAWTFVASAHAALMAGLTPYFVDVAADTWALEPELVLKSISEAPGDVGAVMPVAPFGRAIDVPAWDRFRFTTGLPVVIDAAAGFDTLVPGDVPAVVSLHATKVLGTGEGGFVASRDTALIRSIRARSNFGFDGTRDSIAPSSNAKLSEYHAAVGLAALDEWTDTRTEWLAVARAYRRTIPESNRLRFQHGFGESWVSSTCVLRFTDCEADEVETALTREGIETRRWWGKGAHLHPVTSLFPRALLPVTEALAHATLALPLHRDLDTSQVGHVAQCVAAACRP